MEGGGGRGRGGLGRGWTGWGKLGSEEGGWDERLGAKGVRAWVCAEKRRARKASLRARPIKLGSADIEDHIGEYYKRY